MARRPRLREGGIVTIRINLTSGFISLVLRFWLLYLVLNKRIALLYLVLNTLRVTLFGFK